MAEPTESPSAVPRRRRPAWLTWSNVLVAVLLIWAAPRLLPHLAAVAGVQERAARQPTYEVTTRDGRVITHDSLRGRVVLVNVWATWCLPCRVEMPALQSLAASYAADSLVVLGLSVDRGPASAVDRFLAERGITYPVAIIDDRTLAGFGGVQGYPTSILIGRDGVVRHTVLGPVGMLSLRPAITRALREGG
jgi:cytochrome c biogenesis protein CcmG, thiol:disulfide interchange protein DsbE